MLEIILLPRRGRLRKKRAVGRGALASRSRTYGVVLGLRGLYTRELEESRRVTNQLRITSFRQVDIKESSPAAKRWGIIRAMDEKQALIETLQRIAASHEIGVDTAISSAMLVRQSVIR
jgi:hypothetical protein